MPGMHRDRLKPSEKEKHHERFSFIFRIAAAALFNGYVIGFAKGRIFTGNSKLVCVPVLNCYSCPGALGSCPIGALQAVLGGPKHNFSFYVLGTLMLFGTVLGRLICGFLCPFGLIQDLLHKIPTKKIKVPKKADKPLRYLKYLILLIFVVLLPIFATNAFGVGDPFFCKYICPAGTLEGGIFLLLKNEYLRELAGALFNWKVGLLVFFLAGSVFINRFFCRYFCPLGAVYALFNKFSLYRLEIDHDSCIGCKRCEKVCPMEVDVLKSPNSAECIRCGKCKAACPTESIRAGFIK
ncbi:MAG: 4Fe-4S binding protein [Lachnospiraceae bacterium]|nr:4Fe-4S binding protein [Lachnospiraceae bacterium]